MSDSLRDLEAMSVIMKEFRAIGRINRETLIRMLDHEHVELGDRVDDPLVDVKKEYLAAGGRSSNTFIPFIRRVREVAGLGLKEAKELVESW